MDALAWPLVLAAAAIVAICVFSIYEHTEMGKDMRELDAFRRRWAELGPPRNRYMYLQLVGHGADRYVCSDFATGDRMVPVEIECLLQRANNALPKPMSLLAETEMEEVSLRYNGVLLGKVPYEEIEMDGIVKTLDRVLERAGVSEKTMPREECCMCDKPAVTFDSRFLYWACEEHSHVRPVDVPTLREAKEIARIEALGRAD